jgi:hypothetical protein
MASVHHALRLNTGRRNATIGERQEDDAGKLNAQLRTLIKLGAWSKARQLLTNKRFGLHDPSDPAIIEELEKLNPKRATPAKQPPTGLKVVELPTDLVRNVVQRMGKSKAPGLDGWTRELLLPLVGNAEALANLTEMIRDLMSCNVEDITAGRLRSAPLYPFKKDNIPGSTACRPIGPESAITKVASICGLVKCDAAIEETIDEEQYGARKGADKAVHKLRKLVRKHEQLVSLDGTNAYGSYDRQKGLDAVYAETRYQPIWGVTAWAHAPPSNLILYRNGSMTRAISCEEGGKQGASLQPLIYVNGLQPHTRVLKTLWPAVKMALYLDDFNSELASASTQTTQPQMVRQYTTVMWSNEGQDGTCIVGIA